MCDLKIAHFCTFSLILKEQLCDHSYCCSFEQLDSTISLFKRAIALFVALLKQAIVAQSLFSNEQLKERSLFCTERQKKQAHICSF